MRLVFFVVLLLALVIQPVSADTPVVHYQVSTDRIANHKIDVVATFPAESFRDEIRELALPVWTPGSYKVRDYPRFINEVEVLNSGAKIDKVTKNRWLVTGVEPSENVQVRYTVYGHELTVRTNYFTPELGLVVGAATFLAPAPLRSDEMVTLPYVVEFDRAVQTGLENVSEYRYLATDYDQLVDTPMVFGDVTSHQFDVDGTPHYLVQAGDTRFWDLSKSLKDAAKLVKATQEFWGVVPYDRYLFLNLVVDGRGGLEHHNSTVVMTGRFATQDRDRYVDWLSLLSHEFFHTWNIKRLRPDKLGPFDYEGEVYTRSLWIAEGITSYYEDLLVRRAGLCTQEEYLGRLSAQLNNLDRTPGRLAITLGDSSFDAWIRLYQPTDDLHNSTVSYYNKGTIVGWLLDAEIRRHSDGKKSLDDVMRTAYHQFGERGYSEDEFRALASKIAGTDLGAFFERAVDSQQELDYQPALDYWNLSWEPTSNDSVPYLGVEFSSDPRATVTKVYADSPAAKAGIAPGDELLAIEGVRFPKESPLDLIENLKTGGRGYAVLLSRLGRIYTKNVTLGESAYSERSLKFTDSSKKVDIRRNSWLGPDSENVH